MHRTALAIVLGLAFAPGLPSQGIQWQPLAPTGPRPDVVHAAMASDPLRGRIVLFGADATTQAPETWEWDGAVWQAMAPATQPPVRDRGAMAFDPVRGRILLTGGLPTPPPGAGFQDAWEWDGVAWQQLPAVANRPIAMGNAVTTDFGGSRVLFMDAYGSLYAWDGSTWQLLGRLVPLPYQSGMSATVAWDETRGRLVFQLDGFDVTFPPPFWVPTYTFRCFMYEWDGAFHPVSSLPGGAPLAHAMPMTFDAERQRVGVLNHPDLLSPISTWEWSGGWYLAGQQPLAWTPLVAFDYVNATTIVYDEARVPAQATRFFRLASTMPATVVSQGSGCAGSLGVPALAAAPYSRPWIGDGFTAGMDRVPAGSFPFVVVGLAAAQTGLGAFGMPACQQLVTADLWQGMLPAPGQKAIWSMHVPPTPALAGVSLHLQGGLLSAGGAGPLGGAVSQRLSITAGVR
jgi:hypothetical protein